MSVQVQESTNLAPASIYDRKNFMLQKHYETLTKKGNSVVKAQMVLASQNADGISDKDLRAHVWDLRKRKIVKYASFLSIPAFLYMYKFPPQVVALSVIPAYYIAKSFYSCSMLNKNINISYPFAEKSAKSHHALILQANGKTIIDNQTKFKGQNGLVKQFLLKEWLARHEYR